MDYFKEFNISAERGFLPSQPPLKALPVGYESWEELGKSLNALLVAGKVRSEVHKLPTLDTQRLQTETQLERAMLLLSFIAHAYLREREPELHFLPRQIALPWSEVAERLGRPTVLSHASAVLNNWYLIDDSAPFDLTNLALLQSFEGGKDEAWFFLVTAMIEFQGAPMIQAMIGILTGDIKAHTALQNMESALHAMTATLKRMQEQCDPYIFYNRLRPYLASISRVVYEGVSEVPLSFAGGSAAQSSLVQSLDAAMGISHQEPASAAFLKAMRSYMPPKHRAFVEMLETQRPLANIANAYSSELQAIKNGLHNFRTEHLKVYHLYVAAQLKKTALGDTGTGGTDAAAFLRQVRSDTLA